MAIFKKTDKKAASKPATKAKAETKPKVEKKPATESADASTSYGKGKNLDLAQVLLAPHVTEKATDLSEKGVYAFDVNKRANKMEVILAVERFYKVTPRKVAIVNTKAKTMRNRTNNRVQIKKQGGKKALVYLKSGDKIEFV